MIYRHDLATIGAPSPCKYSPLLGGHSPPVDTGIRFLQTSLYKTMFVLSESLPADTMMFFG